MNGSGKSDRRVVPTKLPNDTGRPAEEAGREGGGPKEIRASNTRRTQRRTDAPNALERIRQAARRDSKMRFTALLHHVRDVPRLRTAFLALKKDAAPGVDGETWRHYEQALETISRTSRSGCSGCVSSEAGAAGVHRRPTGGNGRLACPCWKTKSSSGPRSTC